MNVTEANEKWPIGSRVTYWVGGRRGADASTGTVSGFRETPKGIFVEVRDDLIGAKRAARPACVQALTAA